MSVKEILAKNVKAVRKSLNETQADFAYHCGLSEDEISNIENCKANPTLSTLEDICAYIGCTLAELIKEE